MTVMLKPPAPVVVPQGFQSMFLAGSIEQGSAVDWQAQILQMMDRPNLLMFNPRRDKWDASLKQDITNSTFRGQVEWELDAMDRADLIVMYFDPNTKSPITLLELGLHAQSGKLLVGCPDGYWRRGNVQVMCDRYNIPLVNTLEDLVLRALIRLSL